ncbi:MAG: ATP-binding protein [Absicoccus porci]|uniref:ATP-binding protein n=1 Tax=Absicoccus porci TaxID=2486576 RepID=UPI00235243EA|nr:ATP-binding protein [Absicoccus porci]MCI6087438.1 ATP-binding protein [Absicoccus porci]MDD7330745.1 ATP-binding protein [Absicoccus porci]MDY4738275.1 ATP-binding protein [Absicoccus porci]
MSDIELIKKQPIICRFLDVHHLDDSFIQENIIEMLTWQESLKKCEGCLGLSYCRQPLKGHRYQLSFTEDGLSESYGMCSYMREQEKMLAHVKNFRYTHMSTDDYLIDLKTLTQGMTSKQYLEAYAKVIRSLSAKKGIYLCGQAGVGKSYLLKGVANHFAKQGKTVCFVKVPVWIAECRDSMKDTQWRQMNMAQLRWADVVIFDDIGAEYISPWTLNEIVFPILDVRMEQKKKTYFTSNYQWPELESRYAACQKEGRVAANRILERIRALSDVVLLMGTSLR